MTTKNQNICDRGNYKVTREYTNPEDGIPLPSIKFRGCGKELDKCYMDGTWKHCGEFNEFCRECQKNNSPVISEKHSKEPTTARRGKQSQEEIDASRVGEGLPSEKQTRSGIFSTQDLEKKSCHFPNCNRKTIRKSNAWKNYFCHNHQHFFTGTSGKVIYKKVAEIIIKERLRIKAEVEKLLVDLHKEGYYPVELLNKLKKRLFG